MAYGLSEKRGISASPISPEQRQARRTEGMKAMGVNTDLARMQNLNRDRDQDALRDQNQRDIQGDPNEEDGDVMQDEDEEIEKMVQDDDRMHKMMLHKAKITAELNTRTKKNILEERRIESIFILSDVLTGFGYGCNIIPVIGTILGLAPLSMGMIIYFLGRLKYRPINKEWKKIFQEMKDANIKELSVKIHPNKVVELIDKLKRSIRKAIVISFGILSIFFLVGGLLIGAVCALPGVC